MHSIEIVSIMSVAVKLPCKFMLFFIKQANHTVGIASTCMLCDEILLIEILLVC